MSKFGGRRRGLSQIAAEGFIRDCISQAKRGGSKRVDLNPRGNVTADTLEQAAKRAGLWVLRKGNTVFLAKQLGKAA